MSHKGQGEPLAFLAGLEDREQVLRRRLSRVCRRIPKKPTPVSQAIAGPTSMKVEAHHLVGHFETAVLVAQQAVEAAPGQPDVWVAFAKALACINQTDDARQALRQAKHLYDHANSKPSAEYLYMRAVLSQDDRRALEAALSACEADRSYPEALFLASRLAIKQGYPVGKTMLSKIKPLMANSVQLKLYEKITAQNTSRSIRN